MKVASVEHPAIAVVGHLVKDEIKTLSGRTIISLGGTAYNLAALGAIQEAGRICPVCRVGTDIMPLMDELFRSSPRFDLSGISWLRRPNVINRLHYRPDGSRQEWNSRVSAPLRLGRGLLGCDAILLNFISGHDVTLGDLNGFRKRFSGLIYCDYHSLALGHLPNHLRFERYHPRWRDYLSCIDIIQMNLAELSTISRKALGDLKSIHEFCRQLLEAGPEIAIITLGRDGVVVADRDSRLGYYLPAVTIGREVDATGCGDTISSAFLYYFLATENPVKSLEKANRYAAAKATFSGLSGFRDIKNILSRIGPVTRARRIR